MVVCVLCAAGPNGRGVFCVQLGSLVCVFIFGRVSGWVLGSSGVGAFCVRARLGSCCAGVFLLRSGPCCVARILGAVGRPPIYACGLGHLAAGRFLCTALGPVAVSVFCVCLGSLWGVFCVLLWAVPGTAGPIIVWVSWSVA